jgi:hypothetical protein
MSLVRPLRDCKRGLSSYRAAIMCIAALSVVLARSAPPSLPHIYLGSAVDCQADHDHRQCFDHKDSEWGSFPSATLTISPSAVSPHWNSTGPATVEMMTEGWHYNRPPPTI